MSRAKANLAELDLRLASRSQCSRLEIEGGWNAILRVPAVRPDEDTAIDLLESLGVYVHPGHFYDFPEDGYLVVSLIVGREVFSEGISRLFSIF
jgi:hypothetical protein